MSCTDIVDLSSDDEAGPVDIKAIKLEPDSVGSPFLHKYYHNLTSEHWKSKTQSGRQKSEENESSNALSAGKSSNSILERGQSLVDDTVISSASSICPAPLCRQFWKAGNYEDGFGSKVTFQNGKNFLHVHPMFLHSNATSHKWAFGAFAELLDNAMDEIQNGATFVIVDKTINPRDGSPALLFQDDGGGMDPEAIRHCMSFGFSEKKLESAIGKYGNGFKTSSMRLGADAVVFSRHVNNRICTQSIGLLSYTFLTQTGLDRIVVPMVDYEFNTSTGILKTLHDGEHFRSNLSLMLQWSPFSSEEELLKQFDGIGSHGSKIIIYNLWFGDDGNTEIDFDSDPEDIQINVDLKKKEKSITEQHIASRFHYSLRVYLSILYLRIPESFSIILRGRVVEYHNIANDLKFPEFILYRPQSSGCLEGTVITTIGFLKEAPRVNIHGFCVYHKNRLILPYWKVVSYSSTSRGRGIVGVLEANFVEPTHNKQDFERTSLFQKLETRLKEMQWEYWDYHCALIGYQALKKPRATVASQDSSHSALPRNIKPVVLNQSSIAVGSTKPGSRKRKEHGELFGFQNVKKHSAKGTNTSDAEQTLDKQPVITATNESRSQEAIHLMQENKKLHANCLESDKRIEELNHKMTQLQSELEELDQEHKRQLAEVEALDTIKEERKA
ncbi:protein MICRORCHIDIA 6-like [Mangifera indica]|uniref:protein MICRORCHIDIA 6-like n=1 Tax=Mangifera indica TaxID=29780 RepID=UPI001CF9C62F|nr:protein MICRORCHIDIA 6-like [Mangifera indica]XP_044477565.1 protein MICRORCHIDIA 6-like [Mangifera indica]